MMSSNHFYSIGPRWVSAQGKYARNKELYSIDVLSLLLGRVSLSNQVFEGEDGFEKYDILSSIPPSIFLFSSRIYNFLIKQKIFGWSSFPVQVKSHKSFHAATYHIFQFSSQPVSFDFTKSQITSESDSFIDIKGRFFDQVPPPATDIFSVRNTTFIFITEKLQLMLYKEGFTNISFQRNDRMTGMIPIEIFSNKKT